MFLLGTIKNILTDYLKNEHKKIIGIENPTA